MDVIRDFPHPIREIEHCLIPLRDGTQLAARIWLPADAGTRRFPAILEYLPYRKRDGTAERDALTHPWMAGQGYACVRVDMRGNGESQGLMADEYLPQEQQDALEVLDLSDNPVEDLTPLSGMPLRVLLLERTGVVDLAPLAGMKLERLSLAETPVEDLRPLMQAQISRLDLRQTGVTDLTPLGVVPVEELRLDGTRVQSLAPLASCPLRVLTLSRTPVRDLSPLQGRPLRVLDISGTGVTDVTPILGSQLQRLLFTRKRIRTGLDGLRAMRSLREIGEPPHGCKAAPDYWKDIDAE